MEKTIFNRKPYLKARHKIDRYSTRWFLMNMAWLVISAVLFIVWVAVAVNSITIPGVAVYIVWSLVVDRIFEKRWRHGLNRLTRLIRRADVIGRRKITADIERRMAKEFLVG